MVVKLAQAVADKSPLPAMLGAGDDANEFLTQKQFVFSMALVRELLLHVMLLMGGKRSFE